jgi:hypothetical protein
MSCFVPPKGVSKRSRGDELCLCLPPKGVEAMSCVCVFDSFGGTKQLIASTPFEEMKQSSLLEGDTYVC